MNVKFYCAVLIFISVVLGSGYFLSGSYQERRAAMEGGFVSVEEMMLTHRLGLGSRAEYLAYHEARQMRERKEREVRTEMEEKERIKRKGVLKEMAALEHRVQSLPRVISAVTVSDAYMESEANDQFKLACQIANEVDRLAITRGAELDLFGLPKINEMVRSDPASFASVDISNPVRWDDLSHTCKAWFTVDGVYNGVRYQGYYYGIVHSFHRDDQRGIIVMNFDQNANFVNSLE